MNYILTFAAAEAADPDLAELENALNSLSDEEAGILGLALAGTIGALLVFGLVWYILQVIAQWRLFTKAGEPGWKCLIPIYNYYTQYKITWSGTMYWIMLALTVVSLCLTNATGIMAAVAWAVGMALLVINIMENYKLSISYGHGVGFAIGLILLHPIFMLILGFGGSQYIGPNGENHSGNPS